MKGNIFILALILLMAGNLQAQDMFGISYSAGMGTGDLGDYNSKYSFRGVSLDYRRDIQGKDLAFGFSGAWNVFYEEKGFDTYTFETVTASGKQYRYTNAVPITGNIDYTGRTESGMQWFAGIGIGTSYIERTTDFGVYRFQTDAWQFLIAPEVGIAYPIVDESYLFISARYNNNFKSEDLDGQSWFSINAGFCWGSFTQK